MEALQRFGRFLPSRAGGCGPFWRREVIEAILRQVEELGEVCFARKVGRFANKIGRLAFKRPK